MFFSRIVESGALLILAVVYTERMKKLTTVAVIFFAVGVLAGFGFGRVAKKALVPTNTGRVGVADHPLPLKRTPLRIRECRRREPGTPC